MPAQSQFKRIAIGAKFTSTSNGTKGQTFRKVHKNHAIRLKANGVGETHTKVPFSRSAAVEAESYDVLSVTLAGGGR